MGGLANNLSNLHCGKQGAVGIHIVADPGYSALHDWIREYVRDLPQAPYLLEVTNPDPERIRLVSAAILQDDIYLQLSEQQQVRPSDRLDSAYSSDVPNKHALPDATALA